MSRKASHANRDYARRLTLQCQQYQRFSVLCQACHYPDDIKCMKKVECLYECNYRHNDACPKDHCAYLGRGLCSLTKHKHHAKSLEVVMVKEIKDAK